MHAFVDKNDTNWIVELSIGIIEEVKAKLKIDLLNPIDEDKQLMVSLSPVSSENIKLFCDMLFLLCEDQCKEKDITSAQFGRLLGPIAIKGAYTAFFAEWEDFFSSLDRADVVEAMIKMKEMVQEVVTDLVKRVKKITIADVQKQIDKSPTSSQE